MNTYSLKPKDITRKWYVLDASKGSLGRVSTKAARLIIGKDKPSTSPHIDNGDYVIVINSASVIITGNKDKGKVYYRHSGFPGGIKNTSLSDLKQANPNELIKHAVRGMLPDNKLRNNRLSRLKIYAGSEHEHQAQKPEEIVLDEVRA
ncbi:MAG TPA: 50S ribosomal protein L13 [Candidatus Saccharimonadales bacterium]|nr:50S ribosomal protein L13 [Candidatus Saccharimonadales bacterium]